MSLDYATLEILRRQHPAWRLLLAEHAALIASFLHKAFVSPNVRMMSAADLAEALEDELFGLREQLGTETFPRSAMEYLNEWTANERGWLRKHYPPGSDEAHFELTIPPFSDEYRPGLGADDNNHLDGKRACGYGGSNDGPAAG